MQQRGTATEGAAVRVPSLQHTGASASLAGSTSFTNADTGHTLADEQQQSTLHADNTAADGNVLRSADFGDELHDHPAQSMRVPQAACGQIVGYITSAAPRSASASEATAVCSAAVLWRLHCLTLSGTPRHRSHMVSVMVDNADSKYMYPASCRLLALSWPTSVTDA